MSLTTFWERRMERAETERIERAQQPSCAFCGRIDCARARSGVEWQRAPIDAVLPSYTPEERQRMYDWDNLDELLA